MTIDSISFPGVFFTLFGFVMFILQKRIARQAVYWHKRLWKFSGTEGEYQVVFAVGGIVFLILGVLTLFDVIQFRN